VRQIDDSHDAHDQGHPDPDEAVDTADENTGYKRLKETIHVTLLSEGALKRWWGSRAAHKVGGSSILSG
jgi:hypothetical protein